MHAITILALATSLPAAGPYPVYGSPNPIGFAGAYQGPVAAPQQFPTAAPAEVDPPRGFFGRFRNRFTRRNKGDMDNAGVGRSVSDPNVVPLQTVPSPRRPTTAEPPLAPPM